MNTKKTTIYDISSEVTEAELRRYAQEHPRTPERPKALALNHIHVADRVFSHRDPGLDLSGHERHARELIRILGDTSDPFDPLVVVAVGDKFYLVDGHYRLTAYRSVEWRGSVPVRVFDGDLDAAWREGLRLNVRHGRPMSLEDKLEAAWRMTRRGGLSKAVIAREAVVAIGTVTTMRKRLVELREEHQDPEELTWWQAKRGRPKETLDAETYREEVVAEMAKRLLAAFGPGLERRADFLAEAIGRAYPGLPGALVSCWPEAIENLREQWDAAPF